jgi:protein phosphatase
MVYSKPNIIIFGGNTGSKADNDVWILNISKAPSFWSKCIFNPGKVVPCARVYHSAALCT